jgi:hypothetical protein
VALPESDGAEGWEPPNADVGSAPLPRALLGKVTHCPAIMVWPEAHGVCDGLLCTVAEPDFGAELELEPVPAAFEVFAAVARPVGTLPPETVP